MKQFCEEPNHSDLKREVEALRKKIDDLEAGRPSHKIATRAACWRRISRRSALALLAVIVAVLLALGVLVGQSKQDALFIDPDGNVGIGRTDPKATLDVAGTLNVTKKASLSDATITGSLTAGTTTIKGTSGVGIEVTGDSRFNGAVGINRAPISNQHLVITPTKGFIPFNVTDPANSINWLSVFSDGRVIMNGGNVGIGNPDPKAKLDVVGDVRIQGKVTSRGRYQRDDDPESTYEISPRYHLSLTAPKYAGRTKTIPQDVLVALCGGPDGCEVRLAMTRWDSDTKTAAASRSVLFYYSANDGRWRASRGESDIEGVDGDGTTQHVIDIWNSCFFTDGTYSNYRDLGDKEKGMQLLLWNGNGNANRTCELTLIN